MIKPCKICKKETEHFWKHGSGLVATQACEECTVYEKAEKDPYALPMIVFKGQGYSMASMGLGGKRKAIIDNMTGETLASRKELSFKNYD